jgi:hypothetical protein
LRHLAALAGPSPLSEVCDAGGEIPKEATVSSSTYFISFLFPHAKMVLLQKFSAAVVSKKVVISLSKKVNF